MKNDMSGAAAVFASMLVPLTGSRRCRSSAGRPARARRGGCHPAVASHDIEHAYRAIGWNTVILVAGMIPLWTAIRQSGAAEQLAERLVGAVGDSGPILF